MALSSLERMLLVLFYGVLLLGFGLWIALQWDVDVGTGAIMLVLARPHAPGRPRLRA